jgi:hypothetical protein
LRETIEAAGAVLLNLLPYSPDTRRHSAVVDQERVDQDEAHYREHGQDPDELPRVLEREGQFLIISGLPSRRRCDGRRGHRVARPGHAGRGLTRPGLDQLPLVKIVFILVVSVAWWRHWWAQQIDHIDGPRIES